MVYQSILLVVGGYLLGSIPFSYLAGKYFKGKDIRQYGSGTVGGSMVYEHVARWLVVPVGFLDILKAAFPVWLGFQLEMGASVSIAAGLAASIGHNWPVFLGFTGGRGLGTFLGIWLVIFPWGFPWMLGFLAVGWRLGDSAPFALLSLVTMPLLARWIGGPQYVLPVSIAMLLITIVKRLEANRRPLPAGGRARREALLRRLVFDRDIASHKEWLKRKPPDDNKNP
jgi:glycerol-3-phosphate acyltransferase PlsY